MFYSVATGGGQLRAFLAAVARELLWGLPAVGVEVRRWRLRALAIADEPLRTDALHSLTRKRANTDGAALFAVLPHRRNRCLLRLLVAYESIWDLIDDVSERGVIAGDANGRRLHAALLDAVDPFRATVDYYLHHPWKDDGGYLPALVAASRWCCTSLPSYTAVRVPLLEEGRRSVVGVLNHRADAARRDTGLRRWAEHEARALRLPGRVAWYELSAAASCSAAAHVLLALAAEPRTASESVRRAYAAYFPWFSVATTMLDSYVDRVEDLARGAHSYIGHYPNEEIAVCRVRHAIARSSAALRRLPDGHRHAVIVACMVAMYASKDSARTPQTRETTAALVRTCGVLARLLVPILRLWRIAYGQQSA
jgi:tetraprenyl-beta-curcumene synthase